MPQKEVFKLKGVEYSTPRNWKEKILNLSDIVGIYEPYPAHMSGRRIPKDEICSSRSGGHLSVVKEKDAKLPNLVTLPPFLQYLEDYIKAEMIRRKCPDTGPDLKRLKIYQEVFNFIILAFRIYGPLFHEIKKQYDQKLAYYQDIVEEYAPFKRHLYEFSHKVDEEIVYYANLDCREKKNLCEQRASIEVKLQTLSDKQEVLCAKIDKSKNELSELHQSYLQAFDAKKLLSIKADRIRSQIEDLNAIKDAHKSFDEIKVHPENLKLFVKVAKEAHDEVMNKLNDLQDKYKNVVPCTDYYTMQENITCTEADILVLNKESANLTEELRILNKNLNEVTHERDYLFLQYEKWNDPTIQKPSYDFVIRTLQTVARQRLPKAVSVLAQASREMNKPISNVSHDGSEITESVVGTKSGKLKSVDEILTEIETILEYPRGFIMKYRNQVPQLLSIGTGYTLNTKSVESDTS